MPPRRRGAAKGPLDCTHPLLTRSGSFSSCFSSTPVTVNRKCEMDAGPALCHTCKTKNTHPNDAVRAAIRAANALDVEMYARVLAQTPSAPAVRHTDEPQTLGHC